MGKHGFLLEVPGKSTRRERVGKSVALTYKEFGKPLEVLDLQEREVPEPGPGEVGLRLLASPIHPSDMGMILGKYGKKAQLPAVAGREGLAEISALGAGVDGLVVGQQVRFPQELGVWQSHAVAKAEELMVVPAGLAPELACMAWVNPPTAWRVLRDAHLIQGSWVIQNAANSAVGQFVIQMSKHLGLKTLNVVRRPELESPLKAMGADVVVLEDSGYEKNMKAYTEGYPVMLALNSVGGESAYRLTEALSDGGTMVTFGAMSFEPVRFPTRQLIFNDITLKGFWMDRWFRENSAERVQIMMDKIWDMMARGAIEAPVEAKYPLSRWREAIEASAQPKFGKVLLVADELVAGA